MLLAISVVKLPIHHPALHGVLDDGLRAHAPTLCGEVDAFSGALGHIACGITHQDGTVLHAPRARMLWDWMSLRPKVVIHIEAMEWWR